MVTDTIIIYQYKYQCRTVNEGFLIVIKVVRYTTEYKKIWDDFCKTSINSIFLFFRDYMDYHNDRFEDYSLLFYKEKTLIALLPCNQITKDGNIVISSHSGLTFGGLIIGKHTHQIDSIECVKALKDYCYREGISEVLIKPVPILLRPISSEQDVYAFIYNGAKLIKSEPSIMTNIRNYRINRRERCSVRCAEQHGLSFRICDECEYYKEFYELLSYVLDKYHNTKPVHSLQELLLLHDRFSENIRLFGIFDGKKMIAGTVVYEYGDIIHTQYIASDETGRKKRALHLCFNRLIEFFNEKSYLDFGTSMINRGNEIDKGLISFKESFNGNSMLYNTWSLKI